MKALICVVTIMFLFVGCNYTTDEIKGVVVAEYEQAMTIVDEKKPEVIAEGKKVVKEEVSSMWSDIKRTVNEILSEVKNDITNN